MNVGILALQGDVIEHIKMIKRLDANPVEVRIPEDLQSADALIMPGGESTAIGKLMQRVGLDTAIIQRAQEGMPIYGTCPGMILLAKKIENSDQPSLGLIDITVKRNAYGRQIDSFETELKTTISKEPFKVDFIRAPIITEVGKDVEILAEHEGIPVLARQNNILVSSFHPEIGSTDEIHKYFLRL